MRFIPFKKVKYETALNADTVIKRVKNNIIEANWNISVEKIVNNRVFEGRIKGYSFFLIMGRYGMTYGRTSVTSLIN